MKGKLKPDSADKISHGIMSSSPNISVIVEQEPLVLKHLSDKSVIGIIDGKMDDRPIKHNTHLQLT